MRAMKSKLIVLAILLGLAVIVVAQEARRRHVNVVYEDFAAAPPPSGTDRVYMLEDLETGTRCYAIHNAISCVKK